jgi:hypothetical protein
MYDWWTPTVGLRYRRSAGSGTPWNPFGRISLVKREEKRERLSISSEGILGAVKFENDLAADFRAFRDAVRFDLKVDFGLIVRSGWGVKLGYSTYVSTGVDGRSGWSSHSSVGGEDTSFSLLWFSPKNRRLDKDGSDGELIVDMVLLAASNDGVDAMESLETDRDDMKPGSFSSSASFRLISSSSPSSAGSSNISKGDLNFSADDVLSRLHS